MILLFVSSFSIYLMSLDSFSQFYLTMTMSCLVSPIFSSHRISVSMYSFLMICDPSSSSILMLSRLYPLLYSSNSRSLLSQISSSMQDASMESCRFPENLYCNLFLLRYRSRYDFSSRFERVDLMLFLLMLGLLIQLFYITDHFKTS